MAQKAHECLAACLGKLDNLCSPESAGNYFVNIDDNDVFQQDEYDEALSAFRNSIFELVTAAGRARSAVNRGAHYFGAEMQTTLENLQSCPVIMEKLEIMEKELKNHQKAYCSDRQRMAEEIRKADAGQKTALKERMEGLGKEISHMEEDICSIKKSREKALRTLDSLTSKLSEICEKEEARPIMTRYLEYRIMMGYVEAFSSCAKILENSGTIKARESLASLGVSAWECVRSYWRRMNEKLNAIKPAPDMEYIGRLVKPDS